MFEMDDDFDLDEVLLDTVSIIEEEAIRATNTTTTNNTNNKTCDTQHSIQDKSMQPSLKCSLKRKSDTEGDTNAKLPKRSSQDCLRLLESSSRPQSPTQSPSPHTKSPEVPINVSENRNPTISISTCQSPKPPTTWKMKNAGNTSGCGIRTIPAACQRKFPGPAGLLPERVNRVSYASNESNSQIVPSQSEIPMCCQPTQTLDVGPWQALKCDLQDARDLLDKYTVSWVKQRVANRRLAGQKIPFLAAVLHNVDTSSPDPTIVLRDKTGFLNGTIHRSMWESHGGQLFQGSALVLRLVGVACTGSATQQRLYVNVTSNNVVTIYSPSSTDEDVNVTEVRPLDIPEIRLQIKEWEEKSKAEAAASTNSGRNSILFSSILDRTPLRQIVPASPGLPAAPPRTTNQARNTPPQRTYNNVPNQNSKSPFYLGNSSTTPNVTSRADLPKLATGVDQNKVITSTQTNATDNVNLEVSTFLDGLDTDLLFDDF